MIAATILSAGSSVRMGRPKALLRLGSRTFLEAILETSRLAGLEPRFLVLGSDRDKILMVHDLRGVIVLTNPEPKSGPIGSIRATIQALGAHEVAGLVAWPVDLPHVAAPTIEWLVSRFAQSSKPIAVPTFGGRHGHPTLFGAAIFPELLEVPDGKGANSVVRRDPSRVLEVAVSDPAVISRVNTPADYEKLLGGGPEPFGSLPLSPGPDR